MLIAADKRVIGLTLEEPIDKAVVTVNWNDYQHLRYTYF